MNKRNTFTIWILLLMFAVFTGANAAALKKRVAVFSFTDKSGHSYHWWTGQPVGEGMADMLVTELVKTGKFSVMERQEMEQILSEQAMGMSGIVTPETAAQAGKVLGVELAIFGSVTEFGYTESSIGGALKKQGFGLGISSTKATVGVDVRFVNTETGEIMNAESVRKEESKKGLDIDTRDFSFDNQAKFDESLVGKATRAAIDEIVSLCNSAVQNMPWQAKVIKGGAQIYINAGSEAGVQVGDVLTVYRAGEELIDPDTGLSLGSTESKLGTIKVTNNSVGNGKASICVAVTGAGFDRNDIVRME